MTEPSSAMRTTAPRAPDAGADPSDDMGAGEQTRSKPAPPERKKSGRSSRRSPSRGAHASKESVGEVIDEVTRSQDMVAQLLARAINPEMEAAKKDALAVEQSLAKAMEVAMVARQESAQVKDELERVRAELRSAESKSKSCDKDLETAIEVAKKAETAASESKERAMAAVDATDKAEKAAIKAAADAEAAVVAVETAQVAVEKAKEAYEKAQTVTKEEDENVKGVRKAAERAQWQLDDAKKAETTVATSIPKLEGAALTKQQKASEVSRSSHKLRMEVEEAERAMESAQESADGMEGVWYERAMKTVRDRERDLKRVIAASQKAVAEEATAEAAEAEAFAKVEQAKEDLKLRRVATEEATMANKTAIDQLNAASQVLEEAMRAEVGARNASELAQKTFKAAQVKAKKTTVTKAEEDVVAAKEAQAQAQEREVYLSKEATKVRAGGDFKRTSLPAPSSGLSAAPALLPGPSSACAPSHPGPNPNWHCHPHALHRHALHPAPSPGHACAQAMEATKAVQEAADAALAAMKAKAEEELEAAGREHEADQKGKLVDEMAVDLLKKCKLLATTSFEGRMAMPAPWTEEEADAKTAAAAELRQASALANDLKGFAQAKDKSRNLSLSLIDKWRVFHQSSLDRTCSSELWHVKKLLYDPLDGSVLSALVVMVADIIGLSLDRGPPSARHCIVHTESLAQAVMNQPVSFTIISCNEQSQRFEAGGDTFIVAIRFVGLGVADVRAKIIDNEDGSYSVTFKPTCAGKCTVRVSLRDRTSGKDEELVGSPYTCVVAGLSGPPPVASKCEVRGGALSAVEAQTLERFFVSFRDAFGKATHACDLDVWVQPVPVGLSLEECASSTGALPGAQEALAGIPGSPWKASTPSGGSPAGERRGAHPPGSPSPSQQHAPQLAAGAEAGAAAEGTDGAEVKDTSGGPQVATANQAAPAAASGSAAGMQDGGAAAGGMPAPAAAPSAPPPVDVSGSWTPTGGHELESPKEATTTTSEMVVAGKGSPMSYSLSQPPAHHQQLTSGALEITSEVAQLLVEGPPGAMESLVVGSRPLDVTRAPAFDSGRIGRLPPGRALKLDRIEPMTSSGVLRARVRLELEDLEPKDLSTWRELWPAQQPWRSLSWRAHKLAEARREEEMEMEQMALQAAVRRQEALQAGAVTLQSGMRGMRSRNRARALREEAEAAAAEAAAQAAAEAEAEAEAANSRGKNRAGKGRQAVAPAKDGGGKSGKAGKDSGKEAAAAKAGGKGGKEDKKGAAAPAVTATPAAKVPEAKALAAEAPKQEATAAAPSAAKAAKAEPKASAKGDKKAAAKDEGKPGKEGKAEASKAEAKAEQGNKTDAKAAPAKGTKGGKKGAATSGGEAKAKGVGAAEGSVAAAPLSAEDRAAIEIQRFARGRALRNRFYETYVVSDKEGAPAAIAAAGAGGKPGLNLKEVKGKQGKLSKRSDKGKSSNRPGTPGSGSGRSPKVSEREKEKAAAAAAAAAAGGGVSGEAAAGGAATGAAGGEPKLERRNSTERVASRLHSASVTQPASPKPVTPTPGGVLERYSRPKSASPTKRKSPRKLNLNEQRIQSELHGWVTLAVGGEAFVTKVTGRLPVHLRRQHSEQWAIRTAIDSERERERAVWSQTALAVEAVSVSASGGGVGSVTDGGGGSPTPKIPKAMIPHSAHNRRYLSPRPAYFSVVESDPERIGFAYGGVYPGRLHAKGQLVDEHEVRFSVGVSGSYLLYVSLRPPHTPWPIGSQAGSGAANGASRSPSGAVPLQEDWQVPGSPFLLRVAPGNAYPLSTQIPPHELPLRGGKLTVKLPGAADAWTATLLIQARDKMGNLCERNKGEEVTAGFVGVITPASGSAPGGGDAVAGAEPSTTGGAPDAALAKAGTDGQGTRAKGGKDGKGDGERRPSARPLGKAEGSPQKAAGTPKAGGPAAAAGAASPSGAAAGAGGGGAGSGAVDGGSDGESEGSQSAAVTDMKNGSYRIKWTSDRPGTFNVYVKIDGLHVLGSPCRMILTEGPPPKKAPATAVASAGGGVAGDA